MDSSDSDRKQKWKAQARSAARAAFPLSDSLLESLFAAVEASVHEHGCDHTLRATEQWLVAHGERREPVIAWLEENGGFCDCEVLANARDHWQQNRLG